MKIKFVGFEPTQFPFVSNKTLVNGDVLEVDENIANELSERDDFEIIKQTKIKEN